jgi:hypothetical protein
LGTTIVNTIKVTNISHQLVKVIVKASTTTSPIFIPSGLIAIQPRGVVEAEENRFDLQQLITMSNLKVISFERLKRIETIPPSTGSGSE